MKKRLIIFSVLITLLLAASLWPVVRHYQLKARLEKYKKELGSKGEKLLIQELIPPVNLTNENGQAALLDAYVQLSSLAWSNQPGSMRTVFPGKARVAWQQSALCNDASPNIWPALAGEYIKNREHLRKITQIIREHNYIDFRPDYRAGAALTLPYLSLTKDVQQWLTVAALYELHQRNDSMAFDYLLASIELISRLDHEPIFITQLILTACRHIAIANTWEALQNDTWTEVRWKEIQQSWERLGNSQSIENTLRMEMAMTCDTYAQVRENPSLMTAVSASGSAMTNLITIGKELMENPWENMAMLRLRLLWPYWTSYQEERVCIEEMMLNLEAFRKIIRTDAYLHSPATPETNVPAMEKDKRKYFSPIYRNASVVNLHQRYAQVETGRRLLIAAIALKRYHLENKRYPETLQNLAPQFLHSPPVDFMDGKPLRYRLNPSGKDYLIYSVGEDGIDQGGDPSPANQIGKPQIGRYYRLFQGRDWVWPKPASAEEVELLNADLRKRHDKSSSR